MVKVRWTHRSKRCSRIAAGLWGALLALSSPGLTGADSERVVILANSNDPESVALAEYYAERRSIPEANIIQLPTATDETIPLAEFIATVYNPLREALVREGWLIGTRAGAPDRFGRQPYAILNHRIDYLVVCRGIPLRFPNDETLLEPPEQLAELQDILRTNRGSVDSELVGMAMGLNSITGVAPNPTFGRVGGAGDAAMVVRVSRLDGATAADARALVDRAIEAEKTGLMGRAYIDLGGPHERGDEWLSLCAQLAEKAHFDTFVERGKGRIDWRHRIDAPALYFGWYAPNAYGPFRAASWRVPPGAIGYHLHSFGATVVRSTSRRWVGPLVHAGFTATFGYVYEPYLELTVRPHVLLEVLLQGAEFGEAYYASLPVLSWQAIAIGDPLYRPFKVSLEEQLESGGEGPYKTYAAIRQINKLIAEGDPESALDLGRMAFVESPSLALSYKLARLHLSRNDKKGATGFLGFMRYLEHFAMDEIILAMDLGELIGETGNLKWTLEVYEKLLAVDKLPKAMELILLENGAAVARELGDDNLSLRWELRAGKLKEPAPGS